MSHIAPRDHLLSSSLAGHCSRKLEEAEGSPILGTFAVQCWRASARVEKPWRMQAICTHFSTSQGGPDRSQVNSGSKLSTRLTHSAKQLPFKLRASKREYAGTRLRPAMSSQAIAGLSDEQVQRFQSDGFLVLEDFASPEEVQRLRSRADMLVDGFSPESVSVFSTKSQTKKTDQYFLESASNVSFFFEEDAFAEDGSLRQAKALSINKIGHALHDLDPEFRSFSRSEKVAAILQSLNIRRPLPVQSMYIFKQPKIGGEVRPHQDSTFLRTDPPSVVGLWWALEDATKQNGCLWALPGAHAHGVARHFIRKEDDTVMFDKDLPEYSTEGFVPLEVPSGSLVLLHGANVHFSYSNTSPQSRHAYSMHVIEGAPGTQYLPDNWLQRRADFPFEPLAMPQAA